MAARAIKTSINVDSNAQGKYNEYGKDAEGCGFVRGKRFDITTDKDGFTIISRKRKNWRGYNSDIRNARNANGETVSPHRNTNSFNVLNGIKDGQQFRNEGWNDTRAKWLEDNDKRKKEDAGGAKYQKKYNEQGSIEILKSVGNNDDKIQLEHCGSTSKEIKIQDKVKQYADSSNKNYPLHDKMGQKEESSYKDGWDEETQLWNEQKDEVMECLEAKRFPSKEADILWTKGQFELFYKLCSMYGLDPNEEDNEVSSDHNGMAKFMGASVVDDGGNENCSNDS